MLVANEVLRAGDWDPGCAADTVSLEFDGRHRRRCAMTGARGVAFLLDLPQTTVLRDGDGLVLSDGRIVRVHAVAEQLIEIAALDLPSLVRIAWHLGNRHLPTQVVSDRLRIRDDHVITEMVKALGAVVVEIEAAFDPEGGAFTGASSHRHGYSHSDGGAEPHDHDHSH